MKTGKPVALPAYTRQKYAITVRITTQLSMRGVLVGVLRSVYKYCKKWKVPYEAQQDTRILPSRRCELQRPLREYATGR